MMCMCAFCVCCVCVCVCVSRVGRVGGYCTDCVYCRYSGYGRCGGKLCIVDPVSIMQMMLLILHVEWKSMLQRSSLLPASDLVNALLAHF